MPLSFAGIDLVLDWPDPDVNSPRGAVDTWLDRFAPLEDLRLFGCAPVAMADGRWAPRNPSKQAVGLATHNWSAPPRLRLNTLFWPATGASRWAYFVGLVDEARLDRIIAALATSDADTENKHGTLVISEGHSHRKRSLSTKMYLLPPRRIAVDATAGSTKLWLLPLVDERYLWQFIDVANITANNIGSATFAWSLLLGDTKYGSIVPLSNNGFDLDAISADYFKPDALTFDHRSANIAFALDSAAESIGMRVVRDFDGTVYLMAPARSATRLQDSIGPAGLTEKGYEVISGGKADKWNNMRIPETCEVMFRKCCDNGRYHPVAVNAADFTAAETFSGNKVIYTMAEASAFLGSGTIVNTADCTTLATRIARDYYAWLEENYDYTFAGLKEWKPNGYDDWLVYCHAACESNGEPVTRVTSVPYNFGVQQQHQSFLFSILPIRADFGGVDSIALSGVAQTLSVNCGDLSGDTTMFDTASDLEFKVGGMYDVRWFSRLSAGIADSNFGNYIIRLERFRSGAWAQVGYPGAGNVVPGYTDGANSVALAIQASTLVDMIPGEKLRIVGLQTGALTGSQLQWGIKVVRV